MTRFLTRRRPPAPAPRPQLVALTNHFLVRDGRTYAREAWVLFPGEPAPRLAKVAA